MSAAAMLQLKQQLSRLSDKERQEVSAFLHHLKQDTPAWQKEMARRMAEMDAVPENPACMSGRFRRAVLA